MLFHFRLQHVLHAVVNSAFTHIDNSQDLAKGRPREEAREEAMEEAREEAKEEAREEASLVPNWFTRLPCSGATETYGQKL